MKLTTADLDVHLAALPHWTLADGKLHREYQFASFSQAIGFIAMAAMKIEGLDHHPEWANVYNRVSVYLVNRDAGGITMKDLALAAILDKAASQFA